MADRALPDLISRIKVDSSGVDAAMANLTQSFGKANLAMAGLGAGIGLIVLGGKSMIDIAEKHDKAMRGLDQAYAATSTDLTKYQRKIDDFIMSNRRYVSDQSEVIDGYAKLTRSGLTQTEVQRAMNDAVDLAALKHISLTDAVGLLDNAEHGRMRGLIDLGITTAKYTDAQGNLIQANHSVAKSMDELDAKLKGGRQSLTEEEQAMNSMGISWQKFAVGPGAELHRALTNAVQIGDLTLQFLDKMGHDNAIWGAIDDRLTKMATWVKQDLEDPMQRFVNWLGSSEWAKSRVAASLGDMPASFASGTAPIGGRAAGGSVLPGRIYTVGEDGPETLVMGRTGGTVIPSGGNSYHYNLSLTGASAVNDPEGVRRMLQRMQLLGAAG